MHNSFYYCSRITFLKGLRPASVFLITSLTSAIKNTNSLARSENPRCCYCKMHSNWSKSTPMNSNREWRQKKNRKETLSYFMLAFSVLEKRQKVIQEHKKKLLHSVHKNSELSRIWLFDPSSRDVHSEIIAFANILRLT